MKRFVRHIISNQMPAIRCQHVVNYIEKSYDFFAKRKILYFPKSIYFSKKLINIFKKGIVDCCKQKKYGMQIDPPFIILKTC